MFCQDGRETRTLASGFFQRISFLHEPSRVASIRSLGTYLTLVHGLFLCRFRLDDREIARSFVRATERIRTELIQGSVGSVTVTWRPMGPIQGYTRRYRRAGIQTKQLMRTHKNSNS